MLISPPSIKFQNNRNSIGIQFVPDFDRNYRSVSTLNSLRSTIYDIPSSMSLYRCHCWHRLCRHIDCSCLLVILLCFFNIVCDYRCLKCDLLTILCLMHILLLNYIGIGVNLCFSRIVVLIDDFCY